MRILTGKYRGRVIKMPACPCPSGRRAAGRPRGIRPTQNKVRKAVFDILGDIQGLSLLELFAGTGAIGIEALSCGAEEVIFVEKDKNCTKMIRENLSTIGLPKHPVIWSDAPEGIKQLKKESKKFDIIFLDPPYLEGLAKKTLQTLETYDILAPNGFIIVQHAKKENLPDKLGVLSLFKQKSYGDSVLSLYEKNVPKSDLCRNL